MSDLERRMAERAKALAGGAKVKPLSRRLAERVKPAPLPVPAEPPAKQAPARPAYTAADVPFGLAEPPPKPIEEVRRESVAQHLGTPAPERLEPDAPGATWVNRVADREDADRYREVKRAYLAAGDERRQELADQGIELPDFPAGEREAIREEAARRGVFPGALRFERLQSGNLRFDPPTAEEMLAKSQPSDALSTMQRFAAAKKGYREIPQDEASQLAGRKLEQDHVPLYERFIGAQANLARTLVELPGEVVGRSAAQAASMGQALAELATKGEVTSGVGKAGVQNVEALSDLAGSVTQHANTEHDWADNLVTMAKRLPGDMVDASLAMLGAVPAGVLWAASDTPPEQKAADFEQFAGGIVQDTANTLHGLVTDPSAVLAEKGLPNVLMALDGVHAGAAVRKGAEALAKRSAKVRLLSERAASLTGNIDALAERLRVAREAQSALPEKGRGVETLVEHLRGLANRGDDTVFAGELGEVASGARKAELENAAGVAKRERFSAQQAEVDAIRALDAEKAKAARAMAEGAEVDSAALRSAEERLAKAQDARNAAQQAEQTAGAAKGLYEDLFGPAAQRTIDEVNAAKRALTKAQRTKIAVDVAKRLPDYLMTGGVLAVTDAFALGLQAARGAGGKLGPGVRAATRIESERAPELMSLLREAQGHTSKEALLFEQMLANAPRAERERILDGIRNVRTEADGWVGTAGPEGERMVAAWRRTPEGTRFERTEWGKQRRQQMLDEAANLEAAVQSGIDPEAAHAQRTKLDALKATSANADTAVAQLRRKALAEAAANPGIAAARQQLAKLDEGIAALEAKAPSPPPEPPADLSDAAKKLWREVNAPPVLSQRAEGRVVLSDAKRQARVRELQARKAMLERRIAALQKPGPDYAAGLAAAEDAARAARAAYDDAVASSHRQRVGALTPDEADRYRAEAASIRKQVQEQDATIEWFQEHKWAAAHAESRFEMTRKAQEQGRLPPGKYDRPYNPQVVDQSKRLVDRQANLTDGNAVLGAKTDKGRLYASGTRHGNIPEAARIDQFGHVRGFEKELPEVIKQAQEAALFDVYDGLAASPISKTPEEFQALRLGEQAEFGRRPDDVHAIDDAMTKVPDEDVTIPLADGGEHTYKRYGKLSGKYIPTDTYLVLRDMVEIPNQLSNPWNRIRSLWKGKNTILEPMALNRNWLTAWLVQLPMAGIHPLDPRKWSTIYKGLRDVVSGKKSREYAAAQRRGINSGAGSSETAANYLAGRFNEGLGETLKSPLRAIFEVLADGYEFGKKALPKNRRAIADEVQLRERLNRMWDQGDVEGYERLRRKHPRIDTGREAGAKAAASAKKALAAAVWQMPGQIYQLADESVRAIIYHDQLAKGASVDQAVAFAKKHAVDYSEASGLLHMVRNPVRPTLNRDWKPVGKTGSALWFIGQQVAWGNPFITFAAKSVPLAVEWAKKNPEMALLTKGMWDQISLSNMQAVQRDGGPTVEEQRQMASAEGMMPISALMPEHAVKEDGSLRVFDPKFLTSFSAFGGEQSRGIRDKGVWDYLSPFLMQEPVMGVAGDLMRAKDSRDTTTPTEALYEAASKLVPSWTPYLGRSWSKLTGSRDASGRVYDAQEMFTRTFLGIKATATNEDRMLAEDLLELQRFLAEASEDAKRALDGDKTKRAVLMAQAGEGNAEALNALYALDADYRRRVEPAVGRMLDRVSRMRGPHYQLLTEAFGSLAELPDTGDGNLTYRKALDRIIRPSLQAAQERADLRR